MPYLSSGDFREIQTVLDIALESADEDKPTQSLINRALSILRTYKNV